MWKHEKNYVLESERGTNISKLDKGALIFNTEQENGFRVVTVDLKSSDAKYWRDDFLMLTQIQDNAFHTKNYMAMCKQFAKEAFKEEDKNEQVDFLIRRSVFWHFVDQLRHIALHEVIHAVAHCLPDLLFTAEVVANQTMGHTSFLADVAKRNSFVP